MLRLFWNFNAYIPASLTYTTCVQSVSIAAGKLRATILNFGATVAELYVPDRDGNVKDVLLGFSTFDGWKSSENPCMNTIIGRTAGRCVRFVQFV